MMNATSATVQKALAEAEASEQRFRALIQVAPDGMAVLDEQRIVVEVNWRASSARWRGA